MPSRHALSALDTTTNGTTQPPDPVKRYREPSPTPDPPAKYAASPETNGSPACQTVPRDSSTTSPQSTQASTKYLELRQAMLKRATSTEGTVEDIEGRCDKAIAAFNSYDKLHQGPVSYILIFELLQS